MNKVRVAWVIGVLFSMASATVMAEMAGQSPIAAKPMAHGHMGQMAAPQAAPEKTVDSRKAAINHGEIRAMVAAFPLIEQLSKAAAKCQASAQDGNYATEACGAFMQQHSAGEGTLQAALAQVEQLMAGEGEKPQLGHAEMYLLTAFMENYHQFNNQKKRIQAGH
ncbi:hypothetical protein Mmc1_3243 [Magnetococcus marinus MC-1]|uniref:DnrO protein n=1 Tax=Magnetococcus marinus (strain ATCC BAA-1437 / JCM 17883 / MC-1) TaxID=156889 RepID=A0LCP0_MAGMM|nr:hypothetical protein [Magnetococcus marinus]ABK45733.1 hypothetical protein Mmc1_3243 [Magnetococcus marinus MC-1]